MRIGIITFHRANNYGAVLQCYALCSIIKGMGHNVEVIDYYPSYFKSEYSLIPQIKSGYRVFIKRLLKTLLVFSIKKKRIDLFKHFIEDRLPLSKEKYDELNYNIQGYDVIVFGSDQIWNPLLSEGLDVVYAGLFPHANAKFVSYAASTNPKVYGGDYWSYFNQILENFDCVSTREDSLANYLNEIKANSAVTVLDPILLPDFTIWDEIANIPKEKKYLLIYTVPQSPLVRKTAKYLAARLGLEIIEITPYAQRTNDKSVRQLVGPEDFIGYFKNASYVVTTSFHGTAISIKMNKPFTTISVGGHTDDRSLNLLQKLGLRNRLVTSELKDDIDVNIDFSECNAKLQYMINESLNFLVQSI